MSLGKKVIHRENLAVIDAADPLTSLNIVREIDTAANILDQFFDIGPTTDKCEVNVKLSDNAKECTLQPVFLEDRHLVAGSRYLTFGTQFKMGGSQNTKATLQGIHGKPMFIKVVALDGGLTINKIELMGVTDPLVD